MFSTDMLTWKVEFAKYAVKTIEFSCKTKRKKIILILLTNLFCYRGLRIVHDLNLESSIRGSSRLFTSTPAPPQQRLTTATSNETSTTSFGFSRVLEDFAGM